MNLKKSLIEIKKFLKNKYKENLAAILVFGSANTGEWKEGKSDIDLIILFRDNSKLKLIKEKNRLFKELPKFSTSAIHFRTIKNYEKHIYKEGSWSSWITAINGSKKLYSTKEFEKFRNHLIKNPISKKKLINYVKGKDHFELKGYFKKIKFFDLTKALFSHLRRKIQIMNYYKIKQIIFDYNQCLENLNFERSRKIKLKKLYKLYKRRANMPKTEIVYYKNLSKELTKEILNVLS